MNLLLTIATVANPVLTALLTVLVFLESKKSKKQIEDIKNSITTGNQSIVTSVGFADLSPCLVVKTITPPAALAP